MRDSYQAKLELLDRYLKQPLLSPDHPVLEAIKLDVVKASQTGIKGGSKKSGTAPNTRSNIAEATPGSIYIESQQEAAPLSQEPRMDARPLGNGAKGASEAKSSSLYNESMGIYRKFLKERNSFLDMSGRKAKDNSAAMKGILEFMKNFQKSNKKPHEDADILKGIEFLFTQENWNRLNDFHRNRIKLPDIYKNIEEILPMIRNGYNKKTSAKNNLHSFKSKLTSRQ